MTPQELKNSIIQLAMRGQLVPQADREGSGQQLYKRIEAEKKCLGIKTSRKTEPITEEIIPFDIPDNWCWVRFGNIVSYHMGKTPPRAESQWWEDDFPWISIADMPENGHICATKEKVSKSAISSKFNNRISKAGTMIMSFKLTVGRVSILDIDAVHNEAIISIYPHCDNEKIIQSYLFYLLPIITQYGNSKNAIKGKTLNDTSIRNLLIPLPPLAEQKRIVTKIEELLPYIDRYEQAWSRLEEFNKRFPSDMQKSLLQMAIQGKLVEQRPEEGTAEVLYQQIQAEKRWLVKEGKIKKEKPLPEIAEDEVPFEIPESWKWVRLSNVVDVRDGTHDTPKYVKDGIPLVTSKNLVEGGINFDTAKLISKKDSQAINIRSRVDDGDILFAMIGTIGNPVLVKKNREFSIKNMALFKQIGNNLLDMDYLLQFLKIAQIDMKKSANASVQSFVSLSVLRNYFFPLPPSAEQKRIVTKLKELLPLCERLK